MRSASTQHSLRKEHESREKKNIFPKKNSPGRTNSIVKFHQSGVLQQCELSRHKRDAQGKREKSHGFSSAK
jgi:hypothetical protein